MGSLAITLGPLVPPSPWPFARRVAVYDGDLQGNLNTADFGIPLADRAKGWHLALVIQCRAAVSRHKGHAANQGPRCR